MSNVTAIMVCDDWDGADGAEQLLAIRVNGRVEVVFNSTHPVTLLHRQYERELAGLESINMILNRQLEEANFERDDALRQLAEMSIAKEACDERILWE
jgi:hypothetical protein